MNNEEKAIIIIERFEHGYDTGCETKIIPLNEVDTWINAVKKMYSKSTSYVEITDKKCFYRMTEGQGMGVNIIIKRYNKGEWWLDNMKDYYDKLEETI